MRVLLAPGAADGASLGRVSPFTTGRVPGGSRVESGGLSLWLVAGKPCSANGFVSAGGQRNDVSTAALAKERDRLFSFAWVAIFGHRNELCVRRSGSLSAVWAALGVSGVHWQISPQMLGKGRSGQQST
jgi:hypothetical protein